MPNRMHFQGVKGTALWSRDCVEPNGVFTSPVAGLKKLDRNRVVCVRYRDPAYAVDFIYPAKRLPGAEVSKTRERKICDTVIQSF